MSRQALILVCGRPGSGKSTLAKALAKELKAALLDKDCIDEAFSPDNRDDFYQKEIEPKAYHALLNLAELNLNNGQTVVVDAPWTHQMYRQPDLLPRISEVIQATGAVLIVINIELSAEELRKRLIQRGLKRDQEKLTEKGWEEFVKRMRFADKNPLPHLTIDGRLSPEECAKAALAYIRSEL